VSKARSQKSKRPAPRNSMLPGIISAVVVLFVLALIAGTFLTNAPAAEAPAPTAPVAPSVAVVEPAAPVAAADIPGLLPTPVTRSYAEAPPLTIDPEGTYTATFKTPRGEFVVALWPDRAPEAVNNFVFLARENFYNGLTWHRVLQDFMAQGGDPVGDGTGGPGYTIVDEFDPEFSFDRPGILAMARPNAPNSAGSQFFITTAPAPWLDGQYTAFGEVIEGQAIVDAIPLRDPQNPADLATPGEVILGVTITES
jgi:peptidylprolyl isomerase